MARAKERDGVFQRKDRPGWFVSYIDASGKRRKGKVEANTRTQALHTLSAIRTREEKNRILGIKPVSDISTAALLDRYRRYQKTHVRPKTFERLDGILATLKEHLPEKARDITRVSIENFIARRAETVAPGTIRREAAELKHALKLSVAWLLLPENVAREVKLPRLPEGRTRYLTPEELKSALETVPCWMRAPLGLAAFTGMRRGELLSLRWRDVDLPDRRLYLLNTKNGSIRVLVLNEMAIQVLTSLTQGQPEDLVLGDIDPQHLTDCTRRFFAKLGIKAASFHSLRHTAASWLVMKGVDLYTVGEILGHKTPQMTQRYAHLSPDYVAGAMAKLDGVFAGVMPDHAAVLSSEQPVSRVHAHEPLVPAESPHLRHSIAQTLQANEKEW